MRRDDYDDDEDQDEIRDEPKAGWPPMVGLAAIAWILFGCLILLSGGVNVILQLTAGPAVPGQPGQTGAFAAGGVCGLVLVLLFGIAFISVGIQTLRGTAADTLGNGIGSLVFGLLSLSCGGLALIGGAAGAAAGAGPAAIAAFIGGFINIIAGIGLLAAGVMALVGRAPYLAWRRAQSRRR